MLSAEPTDLHINLVLLLIFSYSKRQNIYIFGSDHQRACLDKPGKSQWVFILFSCLLEAEAPGWVQ